MKIIFFYLKSWKFIQLSTINFSLCLNPEASPCTARTRPGITASLIGIAREDSFTVLRGQAWALRGLLFGGTNSQCSPQTFTPWLGVVVVWAQEVFSTNSNALCIEKGQCTAQASNPLLWHSVMPLTDALNHCTSLPESNSEGTFEKSIFYEILMKESSNT